MLGANNNRMISVTEAAAFLGVDEQKIRRLVAAGEIKLRKVQGAESFLGSTELMTAARKIGILDVSMWAKIRQFDFYCFVR